LKRPSGGSCQIAESIGSSVKLTKSDTSTATATVMPNWKKNFPMMPFMNAIGHEHRHDREGRRHHREADFLRRLVGSPVMVLAHAEVAHDVLAHHDRVVDEAARCTATAPSA
jgi:hypothetical protein